MKRVLLTGGTGFVGANLARRLMAQGHEVHLLARPGRPAWRLAGIRHAAHVHDADLTNREAVLGAVRSVKPDWVFHLAAYGAYPHQHDVDAIVRTNVLGTLHLVQACLATGFEVLVNAGSSSEYGFKDHAPAETEWLEPNSDYAVSKASATLYCRYTAQRHNLRIPTLRLYSVYGPWEEPTRLIPTLIVAGLDGRLPPLVGPDIARDYIHVEDVEDAFLRAATGSLAEPGGVYNVGTGVQTTLREAVDLARQEFAIDAEPVWGSLPPRIWDTAVWVADRRRIHDELGWRPRRSFTEGFQAFVDWFRQNPELVAFYRRYARDACGSTN